MLRQAARLAHQFAAALDAPSTSRCPFCLSFASFAASEPSRGKFAHTELPPHYAHIPVIYAAWRDATGLPTGTWASRKLRVAGFVTGALESLPFQQAPRLLIYPHNELRPLLDKWSDGFLNQICQLEIVSLDDLQQLMEPNAVREELDASGWTPTALSSFQVLPRRLQLDPVHRDLLNLTMMHCPDDRIVHCKTRVKAFNADESPCVKRGGSPLVTKHYVTVRCAATNIPLQLDVDCATLDSGHVVRVRDLELAPGQHIVGLHDDTAVLKMEGGKRAGL